MVAKTVSTQSKALNHSVAWHSGSCSAQRQQHTELRFVVDRTSFWDVIRNALGKKKPGAENQLSTPD